MEVGLAYNEDHNHIVQAVADFEADVADIEAACKAVDMEADLAAVAAMQAKEAADLEADLAAVADFEAEWEAADLMAALAAVAAMQVEVAAS
jgi:hypothetical protein